MSGLRIFDSYPLLAWLRNEPSASIVDAMLDESMASPEPTILMSWVNVGEAYYMASRKISREAAEELLKLLPDLPIRLIAPTPDDFVAAAKLKAQWRISYADAFVAALGMANRAPVVTGDPELRAMSAILEVQWIGPPVH
ncbi:twitching motility protein PilT [Bryobacterales bacterium F-183]|nr:twitching motility protein PilT [Bryobacterales bacterium F-183]